MKNIISKKTKIYKFIFRNIKRKILERDGVLWFKKVYASGKKNRNILKYIINNEIIDDSNNRYSTVTPPLFLAIMVGNLETVTYLVEKCNANVEAIGDVAIQSGTLFTDNLYSITPLFFAAICGHLHIMDFLIQKGANVNIVIEKYDKYCNTPLMHACFIGNLDVVKYLLQKNVNNVNLQNIRGYTCLMMACKKKNYGIAKYLLSNINGSITNVKNDNGFTAMYYCCMNEHSDIIRNAFEDEYKDERELEEEEKRKILEVIKLILDDDPTAIINNVNYIKWYTYSDDIEPEYPIYLISPIFCACLIGNDYIVEYVMSRKDIKTLLSIQNESDIWQLLGCSFIDKKKNISKGIEYWKKAQNARNNNNNKNKKQHQILITPPKQQQRDSSLLSLSIWKKSAYEKFLLSDNDFKEEDIICYDNDIDDLTIIQEYEMDKSNDDIYIKSLEIREKIIGSLHEVTIYYINIRGYYLKTKWNIINCIKLWTYTIYKSQKNRQISPKEEDELDKYRWHRIYLCTLVIYYNLSEFNIYDIANIFEKFVLKEVKLWTYHSIYYNFFFCTKIMDYLACLSIQFIDIFLIKIKELQSTNEYYNCYTRVKKLIRELISLNPRGKNPHFDEYNGFTLLQMACARSPICPIYTYLSGSDFLDPPSLEDNYTEPPSLEVIQLLLEAGANPNATDSDNRTPLIRIAWDILLYVNIIECKYSEYINVWRDIVNMLLEYGAHFDANSGDRECSFNSIQDVIHIDPIFHTSLQCLAANTIQNCIMDGYNIKVPIYLENFLNMH